MGIAKKARNVKEEGEGEKQVEEELRWLTTNGGRAGHVSAMGEKDFWFASAIGMDQRA